MSLDKNYYIIIIVDRYNIDYLFAFSFIKFLLNQRLQNINRDICLQKMTEINRNNEEA